MEENNKPIEQAETHPEENRGNQKTFTQDDVNRIVQERLSKERSKLETASQDTLAEREAAITARENKMSCKEYIEEKGYNAKLLDILDTGNSEVFKKTVDELSSVFGFAGGGIRLSSGAHMSGDSILEKDLIAEAFKPKG